MIKYFVQSEFVDSPVLGTVDVGETTTHVAKQVHNTPEEAWQEYYEEIEEKLKEDNNK